MDSYNECLDKIAQTNHVEHIEIIIEDPPE